MPNLVKDKLFWGAFGLVLGSMALVASGILPRSFMLVPAAALIGLIALLPFKSALPWFLAWLPLSFALPLSADFDTLGLWRILALILFGRWLWLERGRLIEFWRARPWRTLRQAMIFVLAGLIWGGLALLGSGGALGPGLKHLLLLVNALLLVPIVSTSVRGKPALVALLKAFGLGALAAVIIGFGQQLAVFFVPLFDFWQWWATQVSPIFSGAATGELLTYSNTWFSYWPGDVATLRIFGPFPDSHAFALLTILGLIIPTTFWLLKGRRWVWVLALGALAVVLSGTRGSWASVLAPLLVAGLIWLSPKIFSNALIRPAAVSFLLILAALPVASAIWVGSVGAERAKLGPAAALSFQRVKSIFDLEELSNKGRLEIWQATLKSIVERPLFGVGPGNFPTVLAQSLTAARRGSSAHSLYLNTAAESGLVGLAFLAGAIILIFGRLRALWRRVKEPLVQALAAALAVYFIWALGYSLVDVVWLNDRLLALTAGLLSLLFVPYEALGAAKSAERRR